MKAFHGKTELKSLYLKRVQAHRDADRIIQGQGWDQGEDGVFRGCSVGCTIENYSHARYEEELAIPAVLAHLQDGLFESLPRDKALGWPTRFLTAVPVGADLSEVWPRFAHWLMVDPKHGVLQYTKPRTRAHHAVQGVAELYADGETETEEEAVAASFIASREAVQTAENVADVVGDEGMAQYVPTAAAGEAGDVAWSAAWKATADANDADVAMYAAQDAEMTAYADKPIELIEGGCMTVINQLKRFDLCIQIGIFPSGDAYRKDSPPDLLGSGHSCTVFATSQEQALALLKPHLDTHRIAAPAELAPTGTTAEDIAQAEGGGGGPQLSLEAAEKVAVRRALMHSGGNKRKAARMLGIGKTTLYRKMRNYDLEGVIPA